METPVFTPCVAFALYSALYSASSNFDRAVLYAFTKWSRSNLVNLSEIPTSWIISSYFQYETYYFHLISSYFISNERLNTRTYKYLSNLLNVLKSKEKWLVGYSDILQYRASLMTICENLVTPGDIQEIKKWSNVWTPGDTQPDWSRSYLLGTYL